MGIFVETRFCLWTCIELLAVKGQFRGNSFGFRCLQGGVVGRKFGIWSMVKVVWLSCLFCFVLYILSLVSSG